MQYNKMILYLSNIIVHHYFTDERFKCVVELEFAASDDLIGSYTIKHVQWHSQGGAYALPT